jgi:hypothetical protein
VTQHFQSKSIIIKSTVTSVPTVTPKKSSLKKCNTASKETADKIEPRNWLVFSAHGL